MIHTLNLGLRLILELAALAAVGFWGWKQPAGVIVAALSVAALAALWALFRVSGDGGAPIVAVSGPTRLMIEATVFGSAVAALFATGHSRFAVAFAAVILIHYGVGYERTLALISGEKLPEAE